MVPGEVMGLPGHIRLSLTCSDAMIEFALPVFKRLNEKASIPAILPYEVKEALLRDMSEDVKPLKELI